VRSKRLRVGKKEETRINVEYSWRNMVENSLLENP
jgi:hypothetical protein